MGDPCISQLGGGGLLRFPLNTPRRSSSTDRIPVVCAIGNRIGSIIPVHHRFALGKCTHPTGHRPSRSAGLRTPSGPRFMTCV